MGIIKETKHHCQQKLYKKYFQKSGNYQFCSQKKDLTGTISIKPKKGWKLKILELWHVSASSMGRGVTSTKKIKNNINLINRYKNKSFSYEDNKII